ncbi:MAG: branched-chain amino acid ABC transporter permease [Chloroflexi bacterium]|nr:branched-chain amino acid ABC transporter permease [Chloroflexota bacterium]|tara:strand:+ start:2197 stop:2895 length:699 start_codon:yes stop_codon:yes gene_type:complete
MFAFVRRYVRDEIIMTALILGSAIGIFGIAFGVLSVNTGLTTLQTQCMSIFVFTGASQIAAVSIISTGGSQTTALIAALILAMRNGLYGLRLIPIITGSLPKRLLASQLIIDESTGMASAQVDQKDSFRAFWLGGVSVFIFWNLGTLLGSLIGASVDDPKNLGLDIVFPVTFLALLKPQLTSIGRISIALIASFIALVTTPFLPLGIPILLAALAVLLPVFFPSFKYFKDNL